MTEPERRVTVFGGTGFLGRRIVPHLVEHGFAVRVATRHPRCTAPLPKGAAHEVEAISADINDETSVPAAVAGAFAVVNAVSLYVERGRQTFHSVHVEAAARLARHARERGVEQLVHVSGIGADAHSPSRYIRSRGQGEDAARAAFPNATVIRSAVMFGPDDAFLTPLVNLLRRFPVFPMFGRGRTRLQPVHVEDVAEAVAQVLATSKQEPVYELGGPDVYTYETLLRAIAGGLGLKRILVPVPFEVWRAFSLAAEMLPRPPLTVNQVELMEIDNVASPGRPGLRDLAIEPRSIESGVDEITRR